MTIVPTISSKVAGPLGAVHLPRLWCKLLLSSKGMLPSDYDQCGEGFDAMTISALGLKRDEVIEFVHKQQPTYMAFEKWVIQKNGGKVDRAKIDSHNKAILGYNHKDETAASMRKDSGIEDASIKDAATLNTIDDFDQLHQQVVG